MWNDFKEKQPESESSSFLVFCQFSACREQNVAYLGDNGFFYSEETDALLPVTHWKELDKDPESKQG